VNVLVGHSGKKKKGGLEEREKKREMATPEADEGRKERDRLGRPSSVMQPFVVVNSRRRGKKWERAVFDVVGNISTRWAAHLWIRMGSH
jgi:hypothetical protein